MLDVTVREHWGLSSTEVAERTARGETNVITSDAHRSYARVVIQHALTFLNLLIFGVSIVLALLGLYVDAVLAGVLGATNVLVAIVQEIRARRALERLAVLIRPFAAVIRDGRETSVRIHEVVRDDVVVARAGDQIVADGTVLNARGAAMDESLLTGESELVLKAAGDLLVAGSFCMVGQVTYLAERVGHERTTEQIDAAARAFGDSRTPLQHEIVWLMRGLVAAVVLMTLFVLGSFDRVSGTLPFDTSSMKDASLATAVLIGLIPQGLVLMITVAYAVSILRMARKRTLIRHMNAAESLSHVDVLCLDKTGTITTNDLTVHTLEPLQGDLPHLEHTLGDFVASSPLVNRTAAAIAICCPGTSRPVAYEVPFNSERKWSALQYADDERALVHVLGAPDILLAHLPADMRQDDARISEWTAAGLRVLMFATTDDERMLQAPQQIPAGTRLEPLGLIVLSDQLRPDAATTIAQFVTAGTQLKIISGDNEQTVAALARQAGMAVDADNGIVTGRVLDGMDDAAYDIAAERSTIFARVTPQQKERLVLALRRRGHYVAMIGDGVNDVPALKQAQVAISFRSAAPLARSVADVLLLDDGFTALPAALLEGQRIRNGLQVAIELFLTRTIYTMLIIWAAVLAGGAFPVAFRHSALVALLAVGVPGFALALWSPADNVQSRALSAAMNIAVPAAVSIALVGFAVYQTCTRMFDVLVAQSALTAVTLICSLLLILFLRPPTAFWTGAAERTTDMRPTLLAGLMMLSFLAVLYVPLLQSFYTLEPLPLTSYPLIAGGAVGWVYLVRWLWRHGGLPRVSAWWQRVWMRATNGRQPFRHVRTSS